MKRGLKINHRQYSQKELIDFCREKIEAEQTEKWELSIFEFILDWIDDRPFIDQKTSGTTGKPKLIKLEKRHMVYSALQTCKYFKIDQRKNCYLCIPVEYIGGKMMIVRAAVSGANLLYSKPSGHPFQEQKETLNYSAITPFQLQNSIADLAKRSGEETIIVGGGPVLPALERDISGLPPRIFSTYGMTETSSHIAVRRINGGKTEEAFRIIGSTTISSDDDHCLIIENPGLFEGMLRTKDVVEILDQNHFKWLGRKDNVINSGGVKHHPETLETELEQLIPGEFAISSLPHPALGEELVLVIEGDALPEKSKAELRKKLQSHFHKLKIPRKILCVKEFPRTPNGKLLRKELKMLITNSFFQKE